jgi:hypothetical protein
MQDGARIGSRRMASSSTGFLEAFILDWRRVCFGFDLTLLLVSRC